MFLKKLRSKPECSCSRAHRKSKNRSRHDLTPSPCLPFLSHWRSLCMHLPRMIGRSGIATGCCTQKISRRLAAIPLSLSLPSFTPISVPSSSSVRSLTMSSTSSTGTDPSIKPAAPASSSLHPHLRPLTNLFTHSPVGASSAQPWIGTGVGSYPSIKNFSYEEELSFTPAAGARPFVSYTQRTWAAPGGERGGRSKAMHEESGYLRFVKPPQDGAPEGSNEDGIEEWGLAEGVICQNTGMQEVLAGRWTRKGEEVTLAMDTTSVARTQSAKGPHVTHVRRIYTFPSATNSNPSSDCLKVHILMSTTRTPELTTHLQSELTKQQSS